MTDDEERALKDERKAGYRDKEIETLKADVVWVKKLVYGAIGLVLVGWAKTIGLLGEVMK